jgi:hypothetical protein
MIVPEPEWTASMGRLESACFIHELEVQAGSDANVVVAIPILRRWRIF